MATDVPSDFDLVSTAADSPGRIGILFDRHAMAVHRYLSRRVGRSHADDLLADVFVVALDARARVVPHQSGSALPWLYGVAKNVVRAHLRRGQPLNVTEGATTVDWDAIDERLDATAQGDRLRAVLAALSGDDCELLLLIAWERLTPAEAAEALGLTPVAARSRLHRARRRAQATLDDLERIQA
jgi:RNA polymerase sigma-70 factor (ECF subfamily)